MIPCSPFFHAGDNFFSVEVARVFTYGGMTRKNSEKLLSVSPYIVPGSGMASSGHMPYVFNMYCTS